MSVILNDENNSPAQFKLILLILASFHDTALRNCDERAAAILRQHYGRPYFLPANEEEAKLEWIYLGSPGYRETMHIDVVEQPTWQAQLRGIKRWFLHPPPECYYQCESLEVTLQPGEISM
ncbi:unnamed protein product, partial [Timema podura]|nr:unnamed protein product [Timema podura]